MKNKAVKVKPVNAGFFVFWNGEKPSDAILYKDVIEIMLIRYGFITEDLVGLRFILKGNAYVSYEVYEDTEGFWDLWKRLKDVFGIEIEKYEALIAKNKIFDPVTICVIH